MATYKKITELKSPEDFRDFVEESGWNIPCRAAGLEAFSKPLAHGSGKIGNRWAILPMEGWDCEDDGNPSALTARRWERFATSGAKLIYGTEAAAVMYEGRSNTRQLWIAPHTYDRIARQLEVMREAHARRFGCADDLRVGLQLTHSGRYSHSNDDMRLESRIAYHHPLLDKKFGNTPKDLVRDDELRRIIDRFIEAAQLAERAGFDFVDVKHAHGYMAHELLSAVDRPGAFGGSFENRTHFFREVADGIRSATSSLELSLRLSLADFIPFEKGDEGVGTPMKWPEESAYPYAFGGDGTGLGWNLDEPIAFLNLARKYGVRMICATLGSPYYCPHIQRPAYYPVSDGYAPPEHPLRGVARHIEVTAEIKKRCPELRIVGSGYTCLQEYLPLVGASALEAGMADFIGIGRMVLSYPEICADVLEGAPLRTQCICRTLGECTSAPRAGMVSGCYPLDPFYRAKPEALKLRELKKERQEKES
ncbi:MAG: NADH:flavin oxidoreductase [Verrucomicrobia bacterium]|nr:NADH:flavin oxidoreductase [Verrucomicrobiota bacterium]